MKKPPAKKPPIPPDRVAEVRERILNDFGYLVRAVIRCDYEPFHRVWAEWSISHPFSMLEGPRNHGKSHICTVLLLTWHIVRNPDGRFLIVSKTDEAAAAFVKSIREILETNEILIQCFGEFMGAATWTDSKIQVAQRKPGLPYPEATLEARGLGGTVTRTHWDGIVLDDVHDLDRADSDAWIERDWVWLDEVLLPTLNPGGFCQIRATPYGWNDLRGRVEERAGAENVFWYDDIRHGGGPLPNADWRVLKTPAILRDGTALWEARQPLEDAVLPNGKVVRGLLSIRAKNPHSFERQYQQKCDKPKEGERGTVFNVSCFTVWTKAPDPKTLRLFMRHDPAWTSREEAAKRTSRERKPDYTAITVGGLDLVSKKFYVLEHVRDQLDDVQAMARAAEIARRWMPFGLRRYRVERTGLQMHQAPTFYKWIKDSMPIPTEFYNPQKKKVAEATPFALAVAQGRVLWNPAIFEEYPDLIEFFDLFPTKDVPDDDIDSASGCFLMGERGTTVYRHVSAPPGAMAEVGGVRKHGWSAPAPAESSVAQAVSPAAVGARFRMAPPGAAGGQSAFSRGPTI